MAAKGKKDLEMIWKNYFNPPLLTNTVKSNSWICSQLALCARRQRRIITSAALNELKKLLLLRSAFRIFTLYALDRIKPGMKIEYE
jgi:hypothetical protein